MLDYGTINMKRVCFVCNKCLQKLEYFEYFESFNLNGRRAGGMGHS